MSRLADAGEKKPLIESIVHIESQCMTHGDLINFYEEKRAEELWDYHVDELQEMLDE